MNTPNTKPAVKVAMGADRVWHLVDPKGDTYCGDDVKRLVFIRPYASIAEIDREIAAMTKPDMRPVPKRCVACTDNRRMRGGE